MAEVVGIIAAVPALIQLTRYCKVFAKQLYTYSQTRNSTKLEIENYANQVLCSSTVITACFQTLKRHQQANRASDIIRELNAKGTFRSISDLSKGLFANMKSIIVKLVEQNNAKWSVIQYVKWHLQKKIVLELLLQLKYVMDSLNMMLAITNWESLYIELRTLETMNASMTNRMMNRTILALEKDKRQQKEIIKDQLRMLKKMQDQLIRQGINKEWLDSGQQALLTVGKKIVDGRPLLPRVSSSSRSISSTSSLDSGPDTPPPWPPRGPTGPRGPRDPQDDHGLNGPVLGSSGGPAQVPISSGPSTAQTLPSQRLRNRGRFKSPTESKSQSVPQITLQHVSEPENRSISPESTENGGPSLLSSHESLGLDKNNLVTSARNSSNHGVRMKGAELPARSLMQRDPGDTSRAVQNLQVKEQDDQEELRKISEREKAFEITKQAERYERKRKEEEHKREEELKEQRKLEEQKRVERERKEREQLRREREGQERIKREKREWQELIRKDQKQEKEADMVPIYKGL